MSCEYCDPSIKERRQLRRKIAAFLVRNGILSVGGSYLDFPCGTVYLDELVEAINEVQQEVKVK